MMWLDDLTIVSNEDGARELRADISADSYSGGAIEATDIDGLSERDTLREGSSIYSVADASLWILDSTGTWVQQ